jgi:hypothetical protein
MGGDSWSKGVVSLVVSLAVALVFMSLQACGAENKEEGFLGGKVTIGPLCPVEPCDVPGEQLSKIYAERKIVIYAEGSRAIVEEVSLEQDGYYRTALEPGRYVVDINRIGIDSSDDVPKEIEIAHGQTIRLDIDIDTGIR